MPWNVEEGDTDDRHPKGKGCWYYTYIYECPLCGAGHDDRERRYTEKPDEWRERSEIITEACVSHFL